MGSWGRAPTSHVMVGCRYQGARFGSVSVPCSRAHSRHLLQGRRERILIGAFRLMPPSPGLTAGKGLDEGRNDERRCALIEISTMRAGVADECLHERHALGLRGNARSDEGGAALFLHRRGEILDRAHVDPALRSFPAGRKVHGFARHGGAALQAFALSEKASAVNGQSR